MSCYSFFARAVQQAHRDYKVEIDVAHGHLLKVFERLSKSSDRYVPMLPGEHPVADLARDEFKDAVAQAAKTRDLSIQAAERQLRKDQAKAKLLPRGPSPLR